MLRGLPLGRCSFVLATALILCAGVAQAANTSRPTGRGAIHDNSVYCQNSPGQPARPAYRGTGSQNPFGGECGPGPAVQPPEPEPEEQAEDSCPVTEASARQTGIVLVADQPAGELIDERDYRPGLWIAAGQGQWQEVRDPGQVGLDGLSQDGKKIFEAMRCHRTRMFRFTDAQRLKDTIGLREQIVKLMKDREREARELAALPPAERQRRNMRIGFGGCLDLPSEWQRYPETRATLHDGAHPDGYAARSKPGTKASDAVRSFRNQHSVLDCHAGVQLTVLDAAEKILGPARFNALHPVRSWPNLPPQDDGRPSEHSLVGLGVPLLRDAEMTEVGFWFGSHVIELGDYTSVARHLFVVRYHLPTGWRNHGTRDPDNSAFAGVIKVADMVPGDWGYLINVPDYDTQVPPEARANAGENVFYIEEQTRGEPASRVFFGVGLEQLLSPPRLVNEQEMQQHLADEFNRLARGRTFTADPKDMVWTRLGGPTIDSKYPMEAGPFVPTRS